MKEKGAHFVRAFALALAAHALLFLLFAWVIRKAATVPGVATQPIEIQFSGSGGTKGDSRNPDSPLTVRSPHPLTVQKPIARPLARPAVSSAVQQQTKPAEASSPAPAVAVPAPPTEAPLQTAPPASGPSLLGTNGVREDFPNEPEKGGNGLNGPSGGPLGDGLSGSGAPATVSDIDPAPIQPITAPYPPSARRLGQQGLVKIQADIDDQGVVVACKIVSSSGFASLDSEALEAARSARFMPARKNGKSVASSIIIPVRFRLTQNSY